MNVKFVDGLMEQLKGQTPLPDMDGNPIYKLMQEKDLSGYKMARIARDIHEHRPVTEDRYGEEKTAPEKDIRVMTMASESMMSFAVVNRKPDADGSYGILARINMQRDDKGKWGMMDFFTALDPSGYDKQEARQYVNLVEGINKQYKGDGDKFAADFLQGLSKGDDVWGALTSADYNGRIDNIFDSARKEEQQRITAGEGPIALRKITDGHNPGTFESFSKGETREANRTTTPAILRHGKS